MFEFYLNPDRCRLLDVDYNSEGVYDVQLSSFYTVAVKLDDEAYGRIAETLIEAVRRRSLTVRLQKASHPGWFTLSLS